MLFRTLLTVGITLFLSGCDNGPTSPSDVIGETWSLVSLQETGSAPVVVTDSSLYTVSFGDDDRLRVSSDCNSCGGTYTLTVSSLVVTPLACTKVFCGNESLDAKFTKILQQAKTISVDDDELTIESAAGILTFED
jgi:heat shock protein HslJ